jgi:hypothetical protein
LRGGDVWQQSTALPWAFDVTDSDLQGKKHYDYDLWQDMSAYLERVKGFKLVRRNFFEIENVRLSIEICLDHGVGEAKENFIKKGGGIVEGVNPAMVSLISSAGMTIVDKNLILEDGGVVYHQDGLYNRTSASKERHFRREVDPEEEKSADEVLDEKGSLFVETALEPTHFEYLWGGDFDQVVENMLSIFFVKRDILPRIAVFPVVGLPDVA